MAGVGGIGKMDAGAMGGHFGFEGTTRQTPNGSDGFNRETMGVPKQQGSDDSLDSKLEQLINEIKEMEASQNSPSDESDQDPLAAMMHKHGKHHGQGQGTEAAQGLTGGMMPEHG